MSINKILPTLQERGYTVLALSPDTPMIAKKLHTDKKLNFPLYSDSSLDTAKALGLAYHVEDAIVAKLLNKFNVDLEKASGQKHHNLPVPAVIISDAKGKVTFIYYNADHTKRLAIDKLLEVTK